MARNGDEKLRILYLAQHLLHSTDEEHPESIREMIAYLEALGIKAERKTIYEDLKSFKGIGIDIQSHRAGNKVSYYVAEREFRVPEVRLLADVIQSSRFITKRKSIELVQKLQSLTSEAEAQALGREIYVRSRIGSMDESVYSNVDEIQSAIEGDNSITFQYFDWNCLQQKVPRQKGKLYHVSPWALVCDNENYYMLAFDPLAGILKNYRVDKMLSIEKTDKPREGREVFEKVSISDYASTHFGMFSGEVQDVRLVFENALAGAVIDRFGTETVMVPQDDEHFSVVIQAAVNVQFFGWLSGFGTRVRIVSPAFVAEQMARHCREVAEMYDQSGS